MVRSLSIILLIAVFSAWQLAGAADKPYYRFPLVTDLHDAARVLVYDVFGGVSSSKNITGADINKPFRTYTGPLGRRIPAMQNLSGYARKSAFAQLSAAMQAKLNNKVDSTDPRLSDARTPLAHTQDISTVNGLQTALDGKQPTGSYVTPTTLGAYTGHQNKRNNPHQVVPAQIFSSHTGSRYPLFDASNAYTWQRPLQACVDIYDGATGATGATGPTGAAGKNSLFCNISTAGMAFSYDSSTTGLNPSPAIQAMAVQLWFGNTQLVPSIWTWWTGGTANHVYGTGTSSTFTPSVYSQYSGHLSNNFVAVQVKYSSAVTGKQYCTTGTPIAVTKQGTTGPQGPQGDNATVTESAVISAFGAASNNALVFSETIANTFKIKFKDSNGYERAGITGSGKLVHTDTNGVTRFSYDPTGQTWTIYSGSGTAIMKVYSAHKTRFYNRHGGAAMTIMSSGRVVIGG